jgi:hypothetical protein
MEYSINKIIDSYNNSNLDYLINLIEINTQSHFILIGWKLDYGYWYIKSIYDKLIDDKINYNNDAGWYIKEEPNINNIPIVHSKLIYNNSLITKNTKVLFASFNNIKEITDEYKFIITVYIEKIYLQDKIQRIRKYQDSFLNKLSNYIKEPMKDILYHINKTRNDQQNQICNNEQFNKIILQLTNNIFDMIDINRLEIKKIKPKKTIFSFHNLIKSAVDVTILNNKYNVEIIMEKNVPDIIYNDHKKIKQILINMLNLLTEQTMQNSPRQQTTQNSPRQQTTQNSPRQQSKKEITVYITSTIIDLNNEDIERKNSTINDLYKTNVQYLINISINNMNKVFDEYIKNKLFCPIDFSQNDIINFRISYLLANVLGGNIRLLYSEHNKGTCIEFEIITADKEPDKNN